MTTGKTAIFKEDGVTPADPFDYGSGRIDLSKAGLASAAAVPSIVGFGHQESHGVVSKTQSFTLTDLTGAAHAYSVGVSGPSGAVSFSVSPSSVTIPANGTATITVSLTSTGVTLSGPFQDFEADVTISGNGGPTLLVPLWVRFQ